MRGISPEAGRLIWVCLCAVCVAFSLYAPSPARAAKPATKTPKITSIVLKATGDVLSITFRSDLRIKTLPSASGLRSKTLVLKFDAARHAAGKEEKIAKPALVKSVNAQTTTKAAYSFALAFAADSVWHKREGNLTIVTRVRLRKPSQQDASKTKSSEKGKESTELKEPKGSKESKDRKESKTAESAAAAVRDSKPKSAPPKIEKNDKPESDSDNDDDEVAKPAVGKNKWALDVIVLDPGHGGKDGGAIGSAGTKEKDVTLGVAKKLGAMIKKHLPGTKVVFTRSDDTFIELDRRGQIANEAGGKLFVSIHCNSTPKKPSPANGFEIYILRPGRTADAVRVAEFENSVIHLESNAKRYKKLTDEQFIIVNMAQSAFVKFSDKFASLLTREISETTPLQNRGVSQAGFYVLVGASMPNVLIETAFLSNKKDERYLKSAQGQEEIAQGILQAIKSYRVYYQQHLREERQDK